MQSPRHAGSFLSEPLPEAIMESLFTHLLAETKAVHDAKPPLRDFVDWPEDLVFEQPVPREVPALPTVEAMAGKGALYAALAAVCRYASWVQT